MEYAIISVIALVLILLMLGFFMGAHKRVDSSISVWPVDSLPLPIYLDPEVAPDIIEPLETALALWNSTIGVRLFDGFTDDTYKSAIAITATPCHIASPLYSYIAASKGVARSASIYVCLDNLKDVLEKDLAISLAHELGHVLGLLDDDIEYSIMNKNPSSRAINVSSEGKLFLHAYYKR